MSSTPQSQPPPPPPPPGITYIRFNMSYVNTVDGMLKVACVILNLVGFICIQASRYSHHRWGNLFSTVSMTGFWFTGILLVLYMFQVPNRMTRVPWLKVEMWFCLGMMLFYMLAASLAASLGWGAYVAAAFFGFIAMIAYGYDAFLKYKLLHSVVVTIKLASPTSVEVA